MYDVEVIEYAYQYGCNYLYATVTPCRFLRFFGMKPYTSTFCGEGLTWFDKDHPKKKIQGSIMSRTLLIAMIRARSKVEYAKTISTAIKDLPRMSEKDEL
jgi:hypothetical protein